MVALADPQLFRCHGYIDGAWREADDGGRFAVTDPATGRELGIVPSMGAGETRRAIEAANAGLPGWRARTAKERANILRKWFELMMANQEDLARLMTAEQGKPLDRIPRRDRLCASFIEWFAEEGKRIYGDTIPSHGTDKRIIVLKEPIGVCAATTPWKPPAAMITRKAGPALGVRALMNAAFEGRLRRETWQPEH